MKENPTRQVLAWLKEVLTADGWFAEHFVTILVENQRDIVYELEQVIAGNTGCCLILKVTRVTNNRPAYDVDFELLAVENPTLNRARAGSATAADVVWHAAQSLDGDHAMLRTVEQTEVANLFQARATMACVI